MKFGVRARVLILYVKHKVLGEKVDFFHKNGLKTLKCGFFGTTHLENMFKSR